ncbi:hypothetical protein Tco_0753201 [Tanacetum coccineum]
MGTIDSMKSVLTQSALDALYEKYYITDAVHRQLPDRNDRIQNSLADKIDVYSRFFDFGNYRIPLSQFLIVILAYFQINLSQLSVIAAAKVSCFEILCRVHGFEPTVGNFLEQYMLHYLHVQMWETPGLRKSHMIHEYVVSHFSTIRILDSLHGWPISMRNSMKWHSLFALWNL